MAIDPEPTHYRALGLPRGASTEEIRLAYLDLVKRLHPDRHIGRPAAERALAERRMREVTEAYGVLGDPERRTAYDAALRGASRTSTGSSGSTGSTGSSSRPSGGPARARSERPATGFEGGGGYRVTPDDGLPGDDPEVSAAVAFLLRRGPLIALLVVAAVLFVGTAYAGQGRTPTPQRTTTTCTTATAVGGAPTTTFAPGSNVPPPPGAC